MSKCLGRDISVRQHSKSEHWAPCHIQTPSRYDWKRLKATLSPNQTNKLINYKSKQPSNLAWNISLTSRLCDIGASFSICLSVRPSFCLSVNSSVMSKFDIYVKVSILINYKTKQPSNLIWNISLPSWLCDIGACFSIRLSVHPSVCLLTVLLCRSSTFTSKLVF